MTKKTVLPIILVFLLAACAPSTVTPPPQTTEPLPTPSLRPTAAEYIPPTPISPSITPPEGLQIEISLPFGKGTISQLAWSPDGNMLALGGSQGIRFYTADTLNEIRFIPTSYLITSLAFSPDGSLLASGSADLPFSNRTHWRRISPWGSENNFVQLWDVETGNLYATLKGGLSYITTVTFSPDGTLLASGSMYPDDSGIRVWKLASIMDGDLVPWQLHKEHAYGVFGIHFSADGKTLISGSGDNSARLWDIDHNRMASILMYRPEAKVKVFALDYNPVIGDAGQQIVALAGADFQHETPTPLLELWDTKTGQLVRELDGHTSSLDSVAYSPDGKLLASGGSYPDNNIHIWDAESGELLRILEAHASGVRNVVFSPDGMTLASSGWDQTIYLWDTTTWNTKASNDEHTSVTWSAAISPDGQILATGGDEGFIRLWDAETGKKLNTLDARSSRITSLAFNANGTILVVGTDEPDFNIQLWESNSGRLMNILSGHQNFVQVMALSPDGGTLATGGALGDNSVMLWKSIAGGPALHVIEGHTRSVKSLAFNADGSTLASGDGTGTIRLVDVATGQIQRTFEGQDCAISALVFELESGILISGGCGGVVRFWDVSTGKMLREFIGPEEIVTEFGFATGTQELVVSYLNGFIWFWDMATGEPTVKVENPGINVQAFRFIPGKILAAMNPGGGNLRLWSLQR